MLLESAVGAAIVSASVLVAAQPAVAVIAGVLTILSILAAAFWAVHRGLNKIEKVVNAELRHNGGSSLKDMARASRDSTEATHLAIQSLSARLARVESRLDSIRK